MRVKLEWLKDYRFEGLKTEEIVEKLSSIQ